MKYLDEFRDPRLARTILQKIEATVTQAWTIMEVCGGQTHSIIRNGIDQLLPGEINLIHGPGCPVCVTPLEQIDRALAIAATDDVIFCTFGDMLRVPGSDKDLFTVKSEGGDVRMVYSPLDALAFARENRDKRIVFFGVGFETTVPTTAMAIYQAKREGLANFFMLVSHVLVPAALVALLSSSQNRVQAFLAAGHVCTVTGFEDYEPIADKYKVPIVVTGFEPIDILGGILAAVSQLENGRAKVENLYPRAVRTQGNEKAKELIDQVFVVSDQQWRGIGVIPGSGLQIREEFRAFDAEREFGVTDITAHEPEECISGLVLQGLKKPVECPMFGTRCTPQNPLGATMVSSEGACAAYYKYNRRVEPGVERG